MYSTTVETQMKNNLIVSFQQNTEYGNHCHYIKIIMLLKLQAIRLHSPLYYIMISIYMCFKFILGRENRFTNSTAESTAVA